MKNLILFLFLSLTLKTFAQSTHYTYDNAQRLASIVYSNGLTISYAYDKLGNRIQKSVLLVNPDSSITLKLFIEGYYQGQGLMRPALYNQGACLNNQVADSVTIELHQAISPHNIVAFKKVPLQRDGSAIAQFPSLSGLYYIAVKQRNSIETWSAMPIALGGNYDFTTSDAKAYGSNQTEIAPFVWAFYSGDINQDENTDLLDVSILETDMSNFLFGYYASDLNGDGNIDLLDSPILEMNTSNFIFSNKP